MDCKFDWAQIISNEVLHQLSNYQQTRRFFMMAYIVYATIYNFFVNELPIKRDIDVSQEPIYFWYPT